MRVGFAVPQCGDFAVSPASLIAAAVRAEELGYASLWVSERLLWPITLSVPYPASPGGTLPEVTQAQLDPLATLTFVAAHTRSVALGTSVINLPQYQPLRLARMLATMDVLSGGRLRVGLGNGWMPEEFSAVGISRDGLGKRADEYIEVLKQIWTDSLIEFDGRYVQIPRSIVALKPVQKPHPPIYMAAFTPSAMRRVARHADGWNPSGLSVEDIVAKFDHIKSMARDAGRDADALELIVRANVLFTRRPGGDKRRLFCGTSQEIRSDVQKIRQIDTDELIVDVQWSRDVDSLSALIERMEEMWSIVQSA
ncbi:MAG: LLM class F420-dependent oxidoreductase [Proteobacteria bacterium]|nr:LLM class F420-dependent oxidoreductase [Pseudomonadota bacterium]